MWVPARPLWNPPPPPPERTHNQVSACRRAEALPWVWGLALNEETKTNSKMPGIAAPLIDITRDPEPLALCYVSHKGGGGEHPPNFTVKGINECEAFLAPAWEGRQGAEAARVSRGTPVPLPPTKNIFPRWLM